MVHHTDQDLEAICAIASAPGKQWLNDLLQDRQAVNASTLKRLRQQHGNTIAYWLAEFVSTQPKTREKFGDGTWLATDRAIQQATDQNTARYKAARFPSKSPVVDICCGLGGDAMALANRGPLLAVDSNPLIAQMAAANLSEAGHRSAKMISNQSLQRSDLFSNSQGTPSVNVLAVDCRLLSEKIQGQLLHIDPDRRPGSRRAIDPELHEPPWKVVDAFVCNAAGAAVKLAPAADIPQDWQGRGERQWISFQGRVRQQVVWFGRLCRQAPLSGSGVEDSAECAPADPFLETTGLRRATSLYRDGSTADYCVPESKVDGEVELADTVTDWIYDFDPAIRAAQLSASFSQYLGLCALGGPAGFFTGPPKKEPHRLAQRFEVLWAGGMNLKKIRSEIMRNHYQIQGVKIRGVQYDPKTILQKLRKNPSKNGSLENVFLLIGRTQKRAYAVLGRRHS